MRKLFSVLCFVLVSSFAFADNNVGTSIMNQEEILMDVGKSIEILSSVENLESEEVVNFDHCTITVETLDSDGNVTNSVTVTNYEADCEAAKRAAYRILGLIHLL